MDTTAVPATVPATAVAGPPTQQLPAGPRESLDAILGPLWQQTGSRIAAQLDSQAFETWIAPNRLLAVEADTAVLGTPNVFVRDMIATHYRTVVEAALRVVLGRPLVLELVIGTSLALE